MKAKKIKSRVFFGRHISRAMDDGDLKEAKACYEDGDCYQERSFDTEAERQAYFQGLSDSNGWEEFFILEDGKRRPSWAKSNLSEF